MCDHPRNVFIRYPGLISVVFTALVLIAGLRDLHPAIDFDPETLLESDTRSLATYQLIEESLKNAVVVLISMECDDIFTRRNLTIMQGIGDAFLNEDGVWDVKSFTHSVIPHRNGLDLEMRPYLPDDWSAQSLTQVRDFSTRHPLVKNLLVSDDARHAIIAVTYPRGYFQDPLRRADLQAQIDAILNPYRNLGVVFRTISLPQIQQELKEIAERDLRRFGLCVGVFLTVGCLLYFRTVRMLAYVALMLALYVITFKAILEYARVGISVYSIVILPLLLAIQLTLLAHVSRSFTGFLQDGYAPADATARMIRQIWKSCLFAALTTMVALLSLALTGFTQSREIGFYGSLGVLLGLLFTFGPGLSLLVTLHRGGGAGMKRPRPTECPRRAAFMRVATVPRSRALVLLLAFVVLCALGVSRLHTDIRITRLLPVDSRTRTTATEMETAYGGRNFMKLEIDSGTEQGIINTAFLTYVMELQTYAETLPHVSGTYSYASIMAMINEVWEGWAPGSYRLPSPVLLLMFESILRTQDFPFTDALLDPTRRVSHLYVRTGDVPADIYLGVVDSIMEHANRTRPPDIEVRMSKGLHSFLAADRKLMDAQARSAVMTLAAVGLVLLPLWRSIRLAAVTVAAIAAPVLATLAVAGFLRIPLNSVTCMLAALAIGIGVDDAVHLVTFAREQWLTTRDPTRAMLETLRVKGSPIVFTSILLIGVFGLFGLTSFPPAIQFGVLTALAFALTLPSVLCVLPALVLRLMTHRDRQTDRGRHSSSPVPS